MALEKGTSSLDWGSAIAVGEVETRPLVLVGGIGKLNGAASAGLVAILDLTPMANRPPPGQPTPKPEVVADLRRRAAAVGPDDCFSCQHSG